MIRKLQACGTYKEPDVGLKKNYQGRNVAYWAARMLLKGAREDRYFRKTAHQDASA